MEDFGFGIFREISYSYKSKKFKLFVKSKFENFSEDVIDFLILFKILKEEFNVFFDVFFN